jgi:hypothetical protein
VCRRKLGTDINIFITSDHMPTDLAYIRSMVHPMQYILFHMMFELDEVGSQHWN